MIRRKDEQEVRVKSNLRGGEGAVTFCDLITEAESHGAGRLFARGSLPVGASIGLHEHMGEFEIYYILDGEAEVLDNGAPVRLKSGDTHVCFSGESHALKNVGTGELQLMMLVLNERA